VLIPLKAIVLNLLAVAAAFGAIVLVFQDGVGSALLGLQEPLDGIFPAIPVLVLCIVFGLSMDNRWRRTERRGGKDAARSAGGTPGL
jgi:RND superfamily putative drug exporter